MAKEYWDLENRDLVAYPTEQGLRVMDCNDEIITTLPKEWTKEQAVAWAHGYTFGFDEGDRFGKEWGAQDARRQMLKALGIEGDLLQLHDQVRQLAQVLYHHDGVCREDVAELAGRYDG